MDVDVEGILLELVAPVPEDERVLLGHLEVLRGAAAVRGVDVLSTRRAINVGVGASPPERA